MKPSGNSPPGPKMDSLWCQLDQPVLDAAALRLRSLFPSCVARLLPLSQDISVLHLLIQARSNSTYSLMIAALEVARQRSEPSSLSQESPSEPVAAGLGSGCSRLLAREVVNISGLTLVMQGVGVIFLNLFSFKGSSRWVHRGAQ